MHQLDETCIDYKLYLQTPKHRALPPENKNIQLAITYMLTKAMTY